jgi:ClpP class serine protease
MERASTKWVGVRGYPMVGVACPARPTHSGSARGGGEPARPEVVGDRVSSTGPRQLILAGIGCLGYRRGATADRTAQLPGLRGPGRPRAAGPRSNVRRAGEVAIIPLYGMVTHRGGFVNCEAAASSRGHAAEVRAAASDAQVDAIVTEYASADGEVIGIPEAAAAMREARAVKPVVAVANGLVASAAYGLAAQADELLVTASGLVGSIGVWGAHEDVSRALEAEGRKVTLVSAGKFKVEGNRCEPLGDEAHGAMKAEVDRYYENVPEGLCQGSRRGGRRGPRRVR